MIALMLPGFFLGVFEKDGMPAELVLRNFIRHSFYWQGQRLYRTENIYEKLVKEGSNLAPVDTDNETTDCNSETVVSSSET